MKCPTNEQAKLAAINLSYAQAEIAMISDRKSIARALAHIQKAKTFLKLLDEELEARSAPEKAIAM